MFCQQNHYGGVFWLPRRIIKETTLFLGPSVAGAVPPGPTGTRVGIRMVRISGNNSSAPTSSSSSQSGRRQSNRKKKGIISSSSSSSTLGSVEGVGAADEASVPKSNRDQQEDKKNENDVNKVKDQKNETHYWSCLFYLREEINLEEVQIRSNFLL